MRGIQGHHIYRMKPEGGTCKNKNPLSITNDPILPKELDSETKQFYKENSRSYLITSLTSTKFTPIKQAI